MSCQNIHLCKNRQEDSNYNVYTDHITVIVHRLPPQSKYAM